jgi:hypothetical protein
VGEREMHVQNGGKKAGFLLFNENEGKTITGRE